LMTLHIVLVGEVLLLVGIFALFNPKSITLYFLS